MFSSILTSLTPLVRPLIYVSLPVLPLFFFLRSSRKGNYYFRLTTYFCSLGLAASIASVYSFGMLIAGRKYDVNYGVARAFYWFGGWAIGWKVEVEGEEILDQLTGDGREKGTGPAVLFMNHQSMVDILILGRFVSAYCCLTSELITFRMI